MWNYMQVEIRPNDALITPTIGPGGMTRDQAHAEVQALLDRAAQAQPAMARLADTWRHGATDDTVSTGTLTWTIYTYDDDPRAAAITWLEGFAATIRQQGLHVTVAHP